MLSTIENEFAETLKKEFNAPKGYCFYDTALGFFHEIPNVIDDPDLIDIKKTEVTIQENSLGNLVVVNLFAKMTVPGKKIVSYVLEKWVTQLRYPCAHIDDIRLCKTTSGFDLQVLTVAEISACSVRFNIIENSSQTNDIDCPNVFEVKEYAPFNLRFVGGYNDQMRNQRHFIELVASELNLDPKIEYVINFYELDSEEDVLNQQATNKTRLHGFCQKLNDGGYLIIIRKSCSVAQQMMTICHELLHVKQMQEGRLQVENDGYLWEGKSYPINLEYLERPWEQEVISMQLEFTKKMVELFSSELELIEALIP